MRASSLSLNSFVYQKTLLFCALWYVGLGALPSAAWSQDSGASTATSHPLITQSVDESRLTTLRGNTHPLARAEYDLGTAAATAVQTVWPRVRDSNPRHRC